MIWTSLSRDAPLVDVVGFLPVIFQDGDPRPAKEQAADRYAHGGGWRPQEGFKMEPRDHSIKYPGDPVMPPLAKARLRNERIFVYAYGYVAVVNEYGKFEVARMD